MCTHHVDLGFAEADLPFGSHICQIYDDEDERNESLLKFIVSGLKHGECNACFSDNMTRHEVEVYLKKNGLSLSEAEENGSLFLSKANDIYFKDGTFIPERMLQLLKEYHENSQKKGFSAARVIGEMSSDVATIPGGSRLLEYESRVSLLLREHPITAVCQYNAREFDGATLMDVLKVHPMMIVRGQIVMNPFYIQAEEFLKSREATS